MNGRNIAALNVIRSQPFPVLIRTLGKKSIPYGGCEMKRVLVILTLLMLFVAVINAQTFRGAINGTILDPSGAAVPGASVKATDIATGVSRTTVSTSDGQYAFQDLPLGTYKVNVSSRGFRDTAVDKV